MSGTSTEDSILNSIPDFADTGGSGADHTSSNAEATGSPGGQGGAGGVAGGGTSSAQPTDTRGGGVGQAGGQRSGADGAAPGAGTAPAGIARRHDGLVEVPSPSGGNTRDLVDPTTGQTVARGGVERHVYEVGQRHARENVTLKQQLAQLGQAVQGMNETTRVARDLNLAPEHQVLAIRVMSDFMRDPVKTLEYLVAEVKSKGYNIPFLTEGVSPGMDLTAVQRLIETKMAPFTQAQQQAQQQQEVQANARRTLDTFLGTYPEAQHHLPVMAEIMKASPDLTLHDAYLHLVSWASQNGLDHRYPLAEQIQAKTQRQQQPTAPVAPQRQIPSRSAMNGTTSMANAATFNENSSWSDIIRSAMEEAGHA